MKLTCLFALALLAVSGCSGVLSYQDADSVFVGPLDEMNLNKMKSTGKLVSKNSYDDLQFAIDRGGKFVGTCRTAYTKKNSSGRITTSGTMQVNVFNILRQETITAGELTVARAIDSNLGRKLYEDILDPKLNYMHCYAMGASATNGTLVFYMQPQTPTFGDIPQNLAVEVDVSGATFKVLRVELFNRTAAPTSVIAQENPEKGNIVGFDANGAITINGSPVRLNGTPVEADVVKHYFK